MYSGCLRSPLVQIVIPIYTGSKGPFLLANAIEGDINQYHSFLQLTALILLLSFIGKKHLPVSEVKAEMDVNKIKKSGFQAVSVISLQMK